MNRNLPELNSGIMDSASAIRSDTARNRDENEWITNNRKLYSKMFHDHFKARTLHNADEEPSVLESLSLPVYACSQNPTGMAATAHAK